jgi:hypothetical protein
LRIFQQSAEFLIYSSINGYAGAELSFEMIEAATCLPSFQHWLKMKCHNVGDTAHDQQASQPQQVSKHTPDAH